MNAAGKLALTLAFSAAVGYLVAIEAAPRAIMAAAMVRLAHDEAGAVTNRFRFLDASEADGRVLVRPSPDLLTSSCVYDVSHGAILVTAAPGADHGYDSVAIYAANSDNIAVFDSNGQPQGVRFVLAMPGQAVPLGEAVVRATTRKGVILDRRLVTDAAGYEAADRARRADICKRI
jgi:uncharacterized membrane protein